MSPPITHTHSLTVCKPNICTWRSQSPRALVFPQVGPVWGVSGPLVWVLSTPSIRLQIASGGHAVSPGAMRSEIQLVYEKYFGFFSRHHFIKLKTSVWIKWANQISARMFPSENADGIRELGQVQQGHLKGPTESKEKQVAALVPEKCIICTQRLSARSGLQYAHSCGIVSFLWILKMTRLKQSYTTCVHEQHALKQDTRQRTFKGEPNCFFPQTRNKLVPSMKCLYEVGEAVNT